ncbi:MAG: ATP-binding cassette domain-containing protein [Nocardioides sp.]
MLSEEVVRIRQGGLAIDGRPILRQIDLAVRSGEFVVVLGANGSGKSTLIRALTGLRPVTSGAVELFGQPLEGFADWHRIGFVPQRTSASGGVPATVREVVGSGRLTRRRPWRLSTSADRAAIAAAIAAVGLQGRERDGISTLSGGQQQRALIARALAGEPELLFLDEPMAGVDLRVQDKLAEVLADLKSEGATMILVAHELGPLARLVDRTVVMRDGRIAYDGAPLTDHEAHSPAFGEAPHQHGPADSHTHHHPEHPHEDHAPHVAAPLDSQKHGWRW